MHWTFWLIDIVLYLEPAHVEEELEEGEDGEDHVHSVPFLHQTIMGVNNKYTNKSSNEIFDLHIFQAGLTNNIGGLATLNKARPNGIYLSCKQWRQSQMPVASVPDTTHLIEIQNTVHEMKKA